MKYRPLSFVVILVALLFIMFDSSHSLRSGAMNLTDKVKIWLFDTQESLELSYQKYIQQAKSIEKYKQDLKDYTKTKLELNALQAQFQELSSFINQNMSYITPDFIPTKAFSYAELGDYDRIWLDLDVSNYPKDKIFGIVKDGYALGIATIKNQRLLGLLNGDEQCSYAVYIGKQKIPAIIRYDSSDSKKILADFIPSWLKVNIGDEVFTSGLDGIFTPNIPVGKITGVSQNYGYITAELLPYAQKKHLDYMWLIDAKIKQTKFDPLTKDLEK